MVRVIERGRLTEKRVVIGSGNGMEQRFAEYKQMGYEVTVMERGKHGEIGVDDALHAGALRELMKKFVDSRRLVLVTGDGNSNDDRVSFPMVAESALQQGWSVEVWAWRSSMSKKWYEFQAAYG
jgi:hypothetical protein